MLDFGALECHHGAPAFLNNGVDGGHAQSGGQNAVKAGGDAATLDVAEDGRTGFNAGAGLDLRGKLLANATQTRAAEGVQAALGVSGILVIGYESFRYNYQGCAAAVVSFLDPFNDLIHAGFLFRDQDSMSTCGHAGVQGNPTNVAAHDFCNHAAVMRFTGGPQAVNGLGGDLDSRIKTEGVVGGVKVVINGLGNANNLQAGISQAARSGQGAFSTNRDEGVNAESLHVGLDDFGATIAFKGVGAGGAQNGTALLGDTANHLAGEVHDIALHNAAPAVTEADKFVAVALDAFEHDSTDHSVEAWAVSTAGENSNFHGYLRSFEGYV